jgi:hypothetical protein
MDNISLVETDQIHEKVQIIMRQTDYTDVKAREKLNEFNFNEIAVIRDYFGITEKKTTPVKSVNQAIYKQLRGHLDGAMKNYRERVDKGEVKKII